MAAYRNLSVFALLVLCFAVAPSTQRFTLRVDEVFPNFGPTVEILELSSGFLDTGELDVSTLRVQSSDGVTITTPGGFTLDGASFSSTAVDVSISTTSTTSEINIIGANALDFFGNTVDFSSSNGNIDLRAEADMQFIGLGTFDAQVDNFNSVGGNIAVSATAGAISFAMDDTFTAAGSLFAADGINGLSVLAAESLTLESVFNNLDVNGNTVSLSGNTLAVNADRNNVVLAAASTLSGDFDDIIFNGPDGIYVVSMESSVTLSGDDVSLSATNGDIAATALFEAVFRGEDATFTSNSAGTRLVASSGMLAKLSDALGFVATNDLSLSAVENFSAHSSLGSVSALANSELSLAGTEALFGSVGSSSFDATDEVSLNAVNGMYITAAQSIVYGSQLPPSSLFPISVSGEDVSLGGSTVAADVGSLDVSGSGDDVVTFRTSDLNRNSAIQMVAEGSLSIDSDNNASFEGGAIDVVAANLLSVELSDTLSLRTGFEAFGSQLSFDTDADLRMEVDDIDIESDGNASFFATTSLGMSADQQLTIFAQRNALLVSSAITITAAEDADLRAYDQGRLFSVNGDVTFVIEDDLAIDSEGVAIFHADGNMFLTAEDFEINGDILNLHGATVNLSSEDQMSLISEDGIIAFAGDNTVEVDNFFASAEFMFLGSPPGQDITFNGDTIAVDNGDLAVSANTVEIDVTDFTVEAVDILFQSGDQKPIIISATEVLSTSSTVSFLPSDDITFETSLLTIAAENMLLTATVDVRSEVTNGYVLSSAELDFSAVDISFASAGDHVTGVTGSSEYVAETMAFESSSGDITYVVGDSFEFNSGAFPPTAVSMTATGGILFSAILTSTANGNADWLQTTELAEITSLTDTTMSATGDISFSGSDIDHTSATLDSTSAADMNIFGRDVEISSATTMTYTIGGDILIDGDSVTLSQTGVTGSVTTTVVGDAEFISNGRLDLFSGGDFLLSSALAANPPTERSIIITTSARSAGISVASADANLEADGDIVFLTTDYATGQPGTSGGIGTNSGGFDINVLAEDTATYTSDFINTPTAGVSMQSGGASYDRKLAINTGALFRSLSSGNIQLTSTSRAVGLFAGDSVSIEAELGSASIIASGTTGNSVTSVLGDVAYENLGGDVSFSTAGTGAFLLNAAGYGTLQSGEEGLSYDVDDSLQITLSGDFDLQADRDGVAIGQSGNAPLQVSSANALVEGADDFRWAFGGAFSAASVGTDTNCEGGNTVSAVCNDVVLFGDTGVSFGASTNLLISAATDILIESSLNNDVTFEVDDSSISATGAATVTGGQDAIFMGEEIVATANDFLFTTQGSHTVVADGTVFFSSLADQLYEADHSLLIEAGDEVIVQGPAIANIYAGGLGRPFGIETNSVTVDIVSSEDFSVAAEAFRTFSEESTFTSGSSVNIQSLGTANLGTDIFFESAEDITIEADTQFLMTSSNILMEFETQQTFTGDIFISSQRAIAVTSERTTGFDGTVDISADDLAFVSFLRDPVDSVTGDSTSATGNIHAQEWTTSGDIILQSADDMTWVADGVITISGGEAEFFTANTNSDISFETLGKLSDIEIFATGIFDSASTRVDVTAVHSATFGSPAGVGVQIGDSITSVAAGDTIMSTGDALSISGDGDVEFTSTGRMITYIGGDASLSGASVLIDADKDVVFERPHRFSSQASSQSIVLSAQEDVDMLFGGDYRFNAGTSASFSAGVIDISVDGAFQDNNDGLSVGDQPFGFRAVLQGTDDVTNEPQGAFQVQANENIDILASVDIDLVFAELDVFTLGDMVIEANGPDGITASTSESQTDISLFTGALSVVGDDFINFLAYGADTGVGHMQFVSEDSIGSASLGYDFAQQPAIGLALVSDQGDVTFNARQAGIVHSIANSFNEGPYGSGQNNTASYYMNPGVNGTLTLSSFGADSDGLGFSASAAGTYLVSEHNIVIEGQNVRFEELGRDPYYSTANVPYGDYNADFYDLQQSRAVVYGYTEQDWTAAGANENGNGVEIVSSVPFEGIRLDSRFVQFSAGGSVRVEAAEEVSFVSGRDFIAESQSSIIIEAHATSDEEIGILIASVDAYYDGNEDGHIQFHAEEDLLLDAAGRLLLEADRDLSFFSGPEADITFNSASGFQLSTAALFLTAAGSITFESAQDIVFETSDRLVLNSASDINIIGNNADDTNSDVVFGNPDTNSGTLSLYGGVDNLSGSVSFDTNQLFINAQVFDLAETTAMLLPEEFGVPSCASLLSGSMFINYSGTAARLCYCAPDGTFNSFQFRAD